MTHGITEDEDLRLTRQMESIGAYLAAYLVMVALSPFAYHLLKGPLNEAIPIPLFWKAHNATIFGMCLGLVALVKDSLATGEEQLFAPALGGVLIAMVLTEGAAAGLFAQFGELLFGEGAPPGQTPFGAILWWGVFFGPFAALACYQSARSRRMLVRSVWVTCLITWVTMLPFGRPLGWWIGFGPFELYEIYGEEQILTNFWTFPLRPLYPIPNAAPYPMYGFDDYWALVPWTFSIAVFGYSLYHCTWAFLAIRAERRRPKESPAAPSATDEASDP